MIIDNNILIIPMCQVGFKVFYSLYLEMLRIVVHFVNSKLSEGSLQINSLELYHSVYIVLFF
jgi:hypothetical protein